MDFDAAHQTVTVTVTTDTGDATQIVFEGMTSTDNVLSSFEFV